ncbi:LOW QUALITY PROTEIN: vegetative cell wall protein GP1 [Colletotrichum tofieldiae]|nr:LOW QUALITY PROTEIN: vegetative cell wall protein GP1 [Colletotrichum tofieldiae]
MANYSSPYTGSTPGEEYYYKQERYQSATPTPSPRGPSSYYYPGATPSGPRPARTSATPAAASANSVPVRRRRRLDTRAMATMPRQIGHHSRKHSWATPSQPKRERRSSYVYVRASTPHGESDEDEFIEVDGRTYVLPAQSSRQRTKRHSVQETYHYQDAGRGYATDYHYPTQSGFAYIERETQPYEPRASRPTANTHARRHRGGRQEAQDPPGYSLKNWDPTEEPILLLGSVFDSNSLGKWIYDWTVYHHGPATPISDMAGELWLLLIQLAGKVKRAEEVVDRVRSAENRELIDDFIDSGERLTDKLRKLLKTCESPMLKAASKKGNAQLGKNAGVEFVETLFGRERELDKTERFMQGVRLFNLRFDANCEDILRNPTQ